jgi:dTDP-4-dehydrorhamnose 3,5-epimerase
VKVTRTALEGVLLLEPDVHRDDRGWFSEFWNRAPFRDATGIDADFVQDNTAWSHAGVLRGLHYQWPDPQGKLVAVLQGAVLDVAVDIRRGSPTFGRWVAVELSAANGRQLWIPEGFAHGYAVPDDGALVHYKCTASYVAAHDRVIRWDDPAIAIDWPLTDPILSAKDRAAPRLADVRPEALP